MPKRIIVQPDPDTILPQEWQNPQPAVTIPAPGHAAVYPEPQAPEIPFREVAVPPLAQYVYVPVDPAPAEMPPEPEPRQVEAVPPLVITPVPAEMPPFPPPPPPHPITR